MNIIKRIIDFLKMEYKISKDDNVNLINDGYRKVSNDSHFVIKYLLPIIIIGYFLMYSFGFIKNSFLPFFILVVVVYLCIYLFTYRKIKIVYWGNEKFLIINIFKKNIEIIEKRNVEYLEEKNINMIGSNTYFIILYKKDGKEVSVKFSIDSEYYDMIKEIEKDIDRRNREERY